MEPYLYFDEIDQFGPQRKQAAVDVSAEELDRAEIHKIAGVRITAEGRVGDREAEYILEGNVEFIADLACSRCADPFPVATSSDFTVRFLPRPDLKGEEELEVEIPAEELDVEYYADRFVSLRDLAAEQIHLSVPMKPLCRQDCLGLCVHCGANMNEAPCTCIEKEPDDRWAALADIREQLSKKNQV